FFAHRDQPVRAQFRFQFRHRVARRDAHANPIRLAQGRRARVETGAIARNLVFAELFDGGVADGDRDDFVHGTHGATVAGVGAFRPASKVRAGAGSGSRPNWCAKASISTDSTRARSFGPPRSANCTTSRPRNPHGLMRWNGSRSIATLNARPWNVQPRRTRKPSAAILAPSTYTPGAPSLRTATTFH